MPALPKLRLRWVPSIDGGGNWVLTSRFHGWPLVVFDDGKSLPDVIGELCRDWVHLFL